MPRSQSVLQQKQNQSKRKGGLGEGAAYLPTDLKLNGLNEVPLLLLRCLQNGGNSRVEGLLAQLAVQKRCT